ncbi:MAG: hypothetical protein KHX03_09690 [Clostridium sp.]|nr:hypothetical protein [Clostridium sp.]
MKYLDEIKEKVYILSGLEQSPKLDLQIESCVTEILAYCYRDDIIEPMILPVSDVIATSLKNKVSFGVDGDISSYKEGDMQITLNSSAGTETGKSCYNGKLEAFKQIRGICYVQR